MKQTQYPITKQKYQLSEKELQILQCGLIDWSLFSINEETGKSDGHDSCGGDHPRLSFTFEDAAKLGFSSKQFAGLVSSLTQKDVIDLEEWEGENGIVNFYWLGEGLIDSIAKGNV